MPGGTECYMVRDEVWAETGMTPHGGFLCIGCLTTRLGRYLTGRDLIDAPVNEPGRDHDTPRLAALKLIASLGRFTRSYAPLPDSAQRVKA
jgi:hypothetical protein